MSLKACRKAQKTDSLVSRRFVGDGDFVAVPHALSSLRASKRLVLPLYCAHHQTLDVANVTAHHGERIHLTSATIKEHEIIQLPISVSNNKEVEK